MLDRWLTLIARAAEAPRDEEVRSVFDDLYSRYTAADRRYHDVRHVQHCLELFDTVRDQATRPDAVELAIWFHDAVYDTHRSDNEAASAGLADSALMQLGVPHSTRQSVRALILATEHKTAPVDGDAALLVDIDLSILGQPSPLFDAYEAGVRFEYGWVPDAEFRAGRAKILQAFLDRPRIYATDDFRAAFESNARENLRRSLARLSG